MWIVFFRRHDTYQIWYARHMGVKSCACVDAIWLCHFFGFFFSSLDLPPPTTANTMIDPSSQRTSTAPTLPSPTTTNTNTTTNTTTNTSIFQSTPLYRSIHISTLTDVEKQMLFEALPSLRHVDAQQPHSQGTIQQKNAHYFIRMD